MSAKYLKPDGTWHLSSAEVEHINTLSEQIDRLTAERDAARLGVEALTAFRDEITERWTTTQAERDAARVWAAENTRQRDRALALLRELSDAYQSQCAMAPDARLLAEIDALLEEMS